MQAEEKTSELQSFTYETSFVRIFLINYSSVVYVSPYRFLQKTSF